MSDQSLVALAKTGDKKAFDKLVVRHQAKLQNAIRKYIDNSSEAHDIIQETFIKAYRAIQDFRGDSAFYSWLYRIAINTMKTHLSQIGRRGTESADVDTLNDNLPSFDAYQDLLHHSLNSLSANQRTVITLREIDGLTYSEIAEQLNIPIGTVRSRIARARSSLRVTKN